MSHPDYFKNLPHLKDRRRDLRQRQTQAEQLLWSYLRKKDVFPYKIRRQFSIHNYIVDFYCHACLLIIEIDGSVHEFQVKNDRKRQNDLELAGYRVIRFSNDDVLKNLEGVVVEIRRACDKLLGSNL